VVVVDDDAAAVVVVVVRGVKKVHDGGAFGFLLGYRSYKSGCSDANPFGCVFFL